MPANRLAGCRVLLAHATQPAQELLEEQLTADGCAVTTTDTRPATRRHLLEHPVDLLILGTLENPADTPALLEELREDPAHDGRASQLPILTLGPTGRGADLHALRALEAGSDHHVAEAGGYILIRASAQALLRTARRTQAIQPVPRQVGPIHIDPDAQQARVGDRPLILTRIEFVLLSTLARQPTKVFSKDELIREVWPEQTFGRTRTLDSHACRLRTKFGQAGHQAVHNVWGVGYRLHKDGV